MNNKISSRLTTLLSVLIYFYGFQNSHSSQLLSQTHKHGDFSVTGSAVLQRYLHSVGQKQHSLNFKLKT
jgi:hypothetical protein